MRRPRSDRETIAFYVVMFLVALTCIVMLVSAFREWGAVSQMQDQVKDLLGG